MISIKIQKIRDEILLAACDEKLLGKVFREKNLKLEVRRDFYHEALVTEEVFKNSLKIATIANLVGPFVVKIAIEEGYVDKENVIYIKKIPHAQFVSSVK